MSKVKIQGNAGGTGIFTVAAPSTNTDRTITLPDVDATVMTTAGGTIAGVTQISNPTETGYASTAAESISKATLRIKTHSADSTLTSFGGMSGGHAYIQRTNGSGSSQYNLSLNPFGGAVTMPNQPAWQLRPNSGVNGSLGNGTHAIGWSDSGAGFQAFYRGVSLSGSSITSIHNANTTGRINIQVPGTYKIWTTLRMENFPIQGNLFIYVNSSEIIRQHVESWAISPYKHGFISAVIRLSAGDYIEVRVACGGGIISGYNDTVNLFSGFLVG